MTINSGTTGIDAIKRGDIPVLDISAARSDDAERRAALAAQLGAACESIGFLVITGHGVEPATLDSLTGAAREFFESDDDEKMKYIYDIQFDPHGHLTWLQSPLSLVLLL